MDPLSVMRDEEAAAAAAAAAAQQVPESTGRAVAPLVLAVEEEDRRRRQGGLRAASPSSGADALPQPQPQPPSPAGLQPAQAAPAKPRPSVVSDSFMPPPPAWLTARLPDDWDSYGRMPHSSLLMNIKTYFVRLERMSLGTLYVTSYELFFVASRSNTLAGPVATPLAAIERLSLRTLSTRESRSLRYMIEIFCKDCRCLRFGFPEDREADCNKSYRALQKLAWPAAGVRESFAFYHKGQEPWPRSIGPQFDGWKLYDPVAEFARMGLPGDQYRLSRLNAQHELCDSYPDLLCVPAAVTEEELALVADFRSKGRLPALCWKAAGFPQTMWRCSQPLVGMGDTRCPEDERFFRIVARLNPEADVLPIFDCRPKINAVGNKLAGKGFEVIENYPGCKLLFMNIHNIHTVRESFAKLAKACMSRRIDQHFSTSVVASGWLAHISEILRATHAVVQAMHQDRQSVVCHCSDGWDRTTQLVSLAQLCLDPYYRTTRGFCVLVEKEWVSFGHKFAERLGQADPNHGHDQRSPVFIQWLDAVYQLTLQFPRHFQFNGRLLAELAGHAISCRFGTFLADSQAEARRLGLAEKTLSVWTYLLASPAAARGVFTNPLYCPSGSGTHGPLPVVSPAGGSGNGSVAAPPAAPDLAGSPPASPSSAAAAAASAPSGGGGGVAELDNAERLANAFPAWQDLLATHYPTVAATAPALAAGAGGEDPAAGSGKSAAAAAAAASGAPRRPDGFQVFRDPMGEVLYPSWSLKKLRLWGDYFLQWQSEEIPLLSGIYQGGGPAAAANDHRTPAYPCYNDASEAAERELRLAGRRIQELELETARLRHQLRQQHQQLQQQSSIRRPRAPGEALQAAKAGPKEAAAREPPSPRREPGEPGPPPPPSPPPPPPPPSPPTP